MASIPPFSPLIWSVGDLTRFLKDLFESETMLQDIWVRGEISNLSRPPSGHVYFTLKDGAGALRCVMWRNTALRLGIGLRDGQAVEAHGSLSIYEAAGQYQLYADVLRPAGEGVLYQEFLRLKARLEAEGLFAAERKRPIPPRPQRIGIVTSPSGAALRDMLNTLQRRCPMIDVVLAPTAVQGDEAPGGILAGLAALSALPGVEVILLARGGGSIEDLQAFNDERVARAIAACPLPVICGVGHETDFTIADFVCDLRAPTPTAAAELASPNRLELWAAVQTARVRLDQLILGAIGERRWSARAAAGSLRLHSPAAQVRSQRQHVDELTRRMARLADHSLQVRRADLRVLETGLSSLGPPAVLSRGYAILTRPDGTPVNRSAQVHPGDRLTAILQDGRLDLQVLPHGGDA